MADLSPAQPEAGATGVAGHPALTYEQQRQAAIEWRAEERQRREIERRKRVVDLESRQLVRALKEEERHLRNLRRRWRREDVRQRRLENARYLWARLKEVNRREVEEKAEHMRSMSWLAALIAGFTMTAPVEFNFNETSPPVALVTVYAIITALVPGLMTVAAMICVYLLGATLKMGKWFVAEDSEEEFMARCRLFAESRGARKDGPPAPRRTFDRFWDVRCEDDWRWTFRLFCWGVTTFFCLFGTMSFLKFAPNTWIPILFCACLLVFGTYWMWIQYSWGRYLTSSQKGSGGGEAGTDSLTCRPRPSTAGDPFDWHIRPSYYTHDLNSRLARFSSPSAASSEPRAFSDRTLSSAPLSAEEELSALGEIEQGGLAAVPEGPHGSL